MSGWTSGSGRQRHGRPASGLEHIGVVEWFRPDERERVEALVAELRSAGIRHLRTGVSWADWHLEGGAAWYDWLLRRLARDLELLPCFTYTPPSLGVVAKSSAPPRRPRDYADFLDLMLTRHGEHFEWVELWNEPNNLNDWDWRLDPEWQVFSEMVGAAAYWVRQRGWKTVLGGMCPTDVNWLSLMCQRGVLAYIDAVGMHGFPGTWEHEWDGWPAQIRQVREMLDGHGVRPEIWITEAGYATWRHDEARQIDHFLDLVAAPVERAYWYSLQDMAPEQSSQEGFHFDERHYHTGLIRHEGSAKLLWRSLRRDGLPGLQRLAALKRAPLAGRSRPGIVVTGGAGFLGANLVDRLAAQGESVLVLDNLSRDGVEDNLAWLEERHGERIAVEIADLRDPYGLADVLRDAREVFHLAAQVAVTTSLTDPLADFEINARGTLNLLEAARRRPHPPAVFFASTNKVYGKVLGTEDLIEGDTRYEPRDPLNSVIQEQQPLDLLSPYGCSKGAADQYVLDYARVFGVPTVVFRMSCLYGPRQFGTEDQGWLAHFLIAALKGEIITIFGNGKQVRDVLYVDDAVAAYQAARQRIEQVQGGVFNLGGGLANAVSLLEMLDLIARLTGRPTRLVFEDWRPGDQPYYVSDTRRFTRETGWQPVFGVEAGVARLHAWLSGRHGSGEILRQTEGVAL